MSLALPTFSRKKVWEFNPIKTRGGIVPPPCHVFACNRANTRTSVLKKLDFSQLWVWKRPYAFYPIKLFHLRGRNKVCQKYQNFMRRDPYKLGRTPLDHQKISKVKHYFGGFQASKLHESFWIFSKKNWNPNPTQPQVILGGTMCPPPWFLDTVR